MAPLPMPPTHNKPHHHAVYYGRQTSHDGSTSSFSDDEDAITPCPVDTHQSEQQHQQQARDSSTQTHHTNQRPTARRSNSWRNSLAASFEHGESSDAEAEHNNNDATPEIDSKTLWRRMLVIQRMFGCYNSARMQAALETGTGFEDGFVPSRICLDLLNDSIDTLPEESRRRLDEFLEHEGAGGSGIANGSINNNKKKSWRQRLACIRVPPMTAH
ncbi:hypothetical protein B0H63DRAFT_473368 [Podospora didyma]|uniref:Uncharacterized protein n=1 Tax=Podospora didyma TaxID=330526 RepID=A0AAE0U019_9PEZI|nr:hypothetical protein B0H63DRAFT_473368 [Podospora didyma]